MLASEYILERTDAISIHLSRKSTETIRLPHTSRSREMFSKISTS